MKVIICGAGGFIGQNLVEHFTKNGDEVTALYSPNSEIPAKQKGVSCYHTDLTDKAEVDYWIDDCDLLLQFAASTSGSNVIVNNPAVHVTDNAIMNSLILRRTLECKIGHYIFPSCSVMYPSSLSPQTEDSLDFNNPIDNKYFGVGNTKLYIEKMCEFYSRISPTKFTVIRHSNTYGPYDKFDPERSHVFAALLRKVCDSENELEIWGTGEEGRDLIYIDDLVRFVAMVAERQHTKFEIFNVGGQRLVKINDLAQLMMSTIGKSLPIKHNLEKPTIPVNILLDCRKACRVIGWENKTCLSEGIRKTWEWYRDA